MKWDSMNTDGRQLSGKRNSQPAMPTIEDPNATEEREQIAGMFKQSGDARVEAETDAGTFTSGLTPHQVVGKLISVRSQPDAAVEHRAQSGRVSKYAAVDSVRREDPW